MKIVCMIGTPPYLNYFINGIAAEHELALVIREDTHVNMIQKIRKKGILKSISLILQRLNNRGRFEQDYNEILGDKWNTPSAEIPLLNVADINGELVKARLEQLQPDLILVHGTSMIANKTLAGMPLVLNLHWGLSPYYKGSYCTEWALLNHDPLNIGFTIHRINEKIDAGEVLLQDRVMITPNDTANRINMKLTREGTAAIIKVISRLKNGEVPIFQQQDSRQGNLYLVKHFTNEKRAQVAALENPEHMKSVLENPAIGQRTIFYWDSVASQHLPAKDE